MSNYVKRKSPSPIVNKPRDADFDDIDIEQPNTTPVMNADNALDVAEQGGDTNDIPPPAIDNLKNAEVIDNIAPRPMVDNLGGGNVRRSAPVKTSTKETVLRNYVT